MNPSFDYGNVIRVSARFADDDGAAIDPTNVYLTYNNQALIAAEDDPIILHYGVDAALVKDSTGNYHVDLTPGTTTGKWTWRFYSTGTGQASQSGEFYVRPDSV